ncbi:MAG: DNA repair protein RecN [Sporomusaceae bacterium]|nr:DNA repair protein RecN [Sporomusaceae bacterium]
MLKSLSVTNFALIEQAVIEFSAGLNVLTGETGAGKSILIDAFNIVLGARASTEFIRYGTDFFRVEALFFMDQSLPELENLLQEQGLDWNEGTLILTRRLNQAGKNVITLNNSHITLQLLKKIGAILVDMHGQHENQALLKPEKYIEILDESSKEIRQALPLYQEIYQAWQAKKKEIAAIKMQSRQREQRFDMLSWQLKEIQGAKLVGGEEETLEKEISRLANMEKISQAAVSAYSLLQQDQAKRPALTPALTELKKHLEFLSRYDEAFQEKSAAIADMVYQLEEVAFKLRDYQESFEFSPKRLDELQSRMDLLYKLKKKYGATVDEVIAYGEKIASELDYMENFDEHIEKLAKELQNLEGKLAQQADGLQQLRLVAATELSENITEHLQSLSMPDGLFLAEVTEMADFTPTGKNEVVFLFSANRGEIPMPLFKVASGGELSRLALAIKTVSARRDKVPTMVFDEVDSGIGGQTGQAVAEKIAQIATYKQVLCITHLPQIAAVADEQLFIEKNVEQDRTVTSIRLLDEPSRILELSRMLVGTELTESAMDNARQMLQRAKRKKENLLAKTQP